MTPEESQTISSAHPSAANANPALDRPAPAVHLVAAPGITSSTNKPTALPPAAVVTVKSRLLQPSLLWMIGLALILGLLGAYVYVPHIYFVETDDAYVEADTVSVVPKVGAYVTVLHVGDNTRFDAGQLLVELDPRDFQAALDIAEADLQSADAQRIDAQAQLAEQVQVIAAAQATIDSDRANLEFAQQQLARYHKLATDGADSAERSQRAESEFADRKANLEHDEATLDATKAQQTVLQAQLQESETAIARQRAAVAQAQLNLSYTKIYATCAGSVANRSVQVGNFVQPGQTLFSAVPNEVYTIANFKESQLTHMQVGQAVAIRVDAFPGLRLHGHVDSFQRGTGSNFALLPPENATGNFVKVVQRIPVKIMFDDPPDDLRSISPGMSVEATVTLHSPPAWLAPLF